MAEYNRLLLGNALYVSQLRHGREETAHIIGSEEKKNISISKRAPEEAIRMCPSRAGPMTPVDATPGVPGIHESGARPCEHQFARRSCRQHPLDIFTHKLRCFSMNKLTWHFGVSLFVCFNLKKWECDGFSCIAMFKETVKRFITIFFRVYYFKR